MTCTNHPLCFNDADYRNSAVIIIADQFGKARAGAVARLLMVPTCVPQIAAASYTLKVELVPHHRWATRDEARRDLFAYIRGYYNRQRIRSALGYITPEQAERKAS